MPLSAIVLFVEAACWKSGIVENNASRVGFVGLSGKILILVEAIVFVKIIIRNIAAARESRRR